MKKLLLLAAFALATAQSTFGASVALWTFESSFGSITGTSTSLGGLAPEIGTGFASGVHANAATWSSPSGNGSAHSFSVNTWSVGDYFQFQTSTVGFTGIGVSFDQTSSGTGPSQFTFAYSTDGSSFTTVGAPYVVLANASPNPSWNSSTYNAVYTFTYDLSSIVALDNASTVYFRLANNSTTSANGGTVASGGTDRVDNFHVFSPIPEPSSFALLLAGGAVVGLLRRRK